ncbi:Hint domain-containing protein, partial [Jiella marina]|uniref:Hint domain-containing protein n=1 Tax=Jiella sp. LLJ827 TaxID=2917712 RepID=UPI002101650A
MASTGQGMYYTAVNQNGSGSYTVVGGPYNPGSPRIVTDNVDSGDPDDPTVLGDISDDAFTINNPGNFEYTYVAALANGDGFIAYAAGYGYYVFQYTYNGYNQYTNSSITANNAPFAICFASGTAIATKRGRVAVEDLQIGDTAVTASGLTRDIIWIGRRTLDCSGENAHMAPVRVKANAFGAGVPERDVLMSPGHPVMVRQNGREVLVPV